MRNSLPYLVLLIAVMVLIGYVSQKTARRRINWEPNYKYSSKIPFGCYLMREYLEEVITPEPEYVDQTIYSFLRDTSVRNHNYVIVNGNFEPSALDVVELCRFAEEGNTVFIASNNFGLLNDTLKIIPEDPFMYQIEADTGATINTAMSVHSDTVEVNLVNPRLKQSRNLVCDRSPYAVAFLKLKNADIKVLGVDQLGNANYIEYKFGNGRFLLHTVPEVFCNYYAAQRRNSGYIFGALSYLPDQATFIDENYKPFKVENDDSRRFILSEPALQLAYYIIIIAGGIALIFGGKRRQRPVPLVPQFRNSTLDFVEQVGALYYRQSDHTNIINKKISYFLESVRARFFVSTMQIDERLMDKVSALSGVPYPQVQKLFTTINRMKSVSIHTAEDLKHLVNLIREFNKRSKR